jgi:hypothetical protein
MPRKITKRKMKPPLQGGSGLIPHHSKTQARYTKKGPKSK